MEKNYQCSKCNNNTFYIKNFTDEDGVLKRIGLYCSKCNTWKKWVTVAEAANYPSVGSEVEEKLPEILIINGVRYRKVR